MKDRKIKCHINMPIADVYCCSCSLFVEQTLGALADTHLHKI